MEMQDAVVAGGELETKLSNAEEQILDLKESINAQDVEIAKKVSVERENAKLAALLGERESRLADLESVHDRLDSANMLSNEHCSRIRVLETQLANKHENIAVLEARIIQEQGSTQNIQLELRKLTQDLASSLAREESIGKELARITQEKIDIKQDLETAHSSLEESKRDLEARLNAVHQANTKCQVLEERIDSQMVSLRISKETITTLQDRLTESETKSARELEATTGKLNCQIAVLSEQKSALDGKLSDLEACVRAAQDSGMMAKAEYEDKLARQQEEYLKQLDLEQQRIGDAHNALEDARAMVKSLEEQVTASRQELSELRDELRDAKIPSPAHKEAIDALTSQITALREEKTELVLRARSIDSRYRTGDLVRFHWVYSVTLIFLGNTLRRTRRRKFLSTRWF
ncbi:hypothetical protein BC835DRAFT_23609 [Cytidiella melzeri]|nr:hypothetical protein BC835DRAFT_23609 [Cytidiella melzeri]